VSAFLARSAAQADRGRPAPCTVTTLHGTDITLVGTDPSYAPLTQFVINASDAATAVSDWLARETVQRFCPEMVGGGTIEVISNFVDVDRFHPDAGEGMSLCGGTGCPVAVHVSNFRAVKRVPWLVRAFHLALQGREARLLLVGDGPEQGLARQAVGELGIGGKVLFLGERDALPELLAPADVFVLSSQQESFGLSALEAMACGTPVVATDSGGIDEVVEHGRTGLLAPLADQRGFAEHLAALLFDRDRAQSMGAAAREVAVARFRREAVVTRYVDLYRRALARVRA